MNPTGQKYLPVAQILSSIYAKNKKDDLKAEQALSIAKAYNEHCAGDPNFKPFKIPNRASNALRDEVLKSAHLDWKENHPVWSLKLPGFIDPMRLFNKNGLNRSLYLENVNRTDPVEAPKSPELENPPLIASEEEIIDLINQRTEAMNQSGFHSSSYHSSPMRSSFRKDIFAKNLAEELREAEEREKLENLKRMDNLDYRISTLNQSVHENNLENTRKIHNLENQSLFDRDEIEEKIAKLTTSQTNVNRSLKDSNNKQASRLDELISNFNDMNRKVTDSIKETTDSLATINNVQEELDNAIEDLKDELEAYKETADARMDTIENTHNRNYELFERRINGLDDVLTPLPARITRLEMDVERLNKKAPSNLTDEDVIAIVDLKISDFISERADIFDKKAQSSTPILKTQSLASARIFRKINTVENAYAAYSVHAMKIRREINQTRIEGYLRISILDSDLFEDLNPKIDEIAKLIDCDFEVIKATKPSYANKLNLIIKLKSDLPNTNFFQKITTLIDSRKRFKGKLSINPHVPDEFRIDSALNVWKNAGFVLSWNYSKKGQLCIVLHDGDELKKATADAEPNNFEKLRDYEKTCSKIFPSVPELMADIPEMGLEDLKKLSTSSDPRHFIWNCEIHPIPKRFNAKKAATEK